MGLKSVASSIDRIDLARATRTRTARAALCAGMLLPVLPAALAQAPGIIDTHSHILNAGPRMATDFTGSLDAAIRRMDQHGIRAVIIMPPPMTAGRPGAYDIESYRAAAQAYPGRIFMGGGGGSLNAIIHSTPQDAVTDEIAKAFETRAEQIAAAGAVAFGEIALHHLSLRPMGPQHPYEWTPPDHPLLMRLADIAAQKDIPIDLHMDLVPQDMARPDNPGLNPSNPQTLKGNMDAFERLLAHNRKTKFIWAHAGTDPLGTRTPAIQRDLLSRNPNLFMSLRLTRAAPPPAFALAPDMRLKPPWLALLQAFPDRFVIGSDFFHSAGAGAQRGPGEETLEAYGAMLTQLPPALAAAIARTNAEKIYRLDTKSP